MFFEELKRSDANRQLRRTQCRRVRRELLALGVKGHPLRQFEYRTVMRELKSCNEGDIADVQLLIAGMESTKVTPVVVLAGYQAMYAQARRGRRGLSYAEFLQARRLAQIAEGGLNRRQILYRVDKLFTPIQHLVHSGNPRPIVVTKDRQRIPTRVGQYILYQDSWYEIEHIYDYDRFEQRPLPPHQRQFTAYLCYPPLHGNAKVTLLLEEIEDVSNQHPDTRLAKWIGDLSAEEAVYYEQYGPSAP